MLLGQLSYKQRDIYNWFHKYDTTQKSSKPHGTQPNPEELTVSKVNSLCDSKQDASFQTSIMPHEYVSVLPTSNLVEGEQVSSSSDEGVENMIVGKKCNILSGKFIRLLGSVVNVYSLGNVSQLLSLRRDCHLR